MKIPNTYTYIYYVSLFFPLTHRPKLCVSKKKAVNCLCISILLNWQLQRMAALKSDKCENTNVMVVRASWHQTRPDIHTHIVRLTCSISWQITYSLDFFFFSIINIVSLSGHQLEEIVHKHAHTNRNIQKHIHRFKNDILINKPTFLCQHFYFLFFLDRYEEWTNDDECSS